MKSVLFSFLLLSLFSGCAQSTNSQPGKQQSSSEAAPAQVLPTATGPVLLYGGTGASSSDVTSIQNILTSMGLTYRTATAYQMNTMSEATMRSYKLIIFPGGNSIQMGNALYKSTTALIRKVVLYDNVPYLGLCAGAFIGGYSIYNGINLTGGVWFDFYADANKGILAEMVKITRPGGLSSHLVWWNGPQLSRFGYVIGKYPDGTPAIVEKKVGTDSMVILSGVHPEAPLSWRSGLGTDLDGLAPDIALAKSLINAAITKTLLPHF